VVLEEAHHGNDTGGSGVHSELILPDCELLDIFGQTGHNVLPIGVKAIGHGLVLVGRVDHGGAQRSRGWQNTVRLAQLCSIYQLVHSTYAGAAPGACSQVPGPVLSRPWGHTEGRRRKRCGRPWTSWQMPQSVQNPGASKSVRRPLCRGSNGRCNWRGDGGT
jgi:hypothetical protein